MSEQIKVKMKKGDFESLLINQYGAENLEVNVLYEENIRLTLYYDKSDARVDHIRGERFEIPKHIGTWQRSGAWYYEKEKTNA